MVVEKELAGTLSVLERDGNTLSPTIRNLWDGSRAQIMVKSDPQCVPDHHVSIHAHVTVEELRNKIADNELANGFANRFLWVAVKRSKTLPFGGNLPEEDFSNLHTTVRDAAEFGRTKGEMGWTEDARDLYREIYPTLSEGEPGLVGSILSRAETQVLRLAVLYTVLDRSNEIAPRHLKAALAIWDYTEASVRYIFRGKTGDRVADKILEAVEENGPLTRSDLYEVLSWHVDSERLDEALHLLKETERIAERNESTTGRPRTIYTST